MLLMLVDAYAADVRAGAAFADLSKEERGAVLRTMAGEQTQDMDRFFRAFATAIQAVASASREAGAGITQCAGAAAELSAKAHEASP